jgi:hypothetical protein
MKAVSFRVGAGTTQRMSRGEWPNVDTGQDSRSNVKCVSHLFALCHVNDAIVVRMCACVDDAVHIQIEVICKARLPNETCEMPPHGRKTYHDGVCVMSVSVCGQWGMITTYQTRAWTPHRGWDD